MADPISIEELDLQTLQSDYPIADPNGRPTQAFQIWWQRQIEAIEAAINNNADIITQQATIISDLETAIRQVSIVGSFTVPSIVLTASDAGSDATIDIAAHTRRYADQSETAVGAGSITGLAYSTAYAVYYDDTTREDTTPTYVATTSLDEAQNNYEDGRHLVGTVVTPASGGGSTSGGTSPPGSGYSPGGGGGAGTVIP